MIIDVKSRLPKIHIFKEIKYLDLYSVHSISRITIFAEHIPISLQIHKSARFPLLPELHAWCKNLPAL